MTDDRNVFRFDLNESLHFERGQEVSEMVGISLEPEISIQTYDDYISIRGVIELVGEYRLAASDDEIDDEVLYFEDHHTKRYIETVEYTADDCALFSHRFPVEISVPSYRIADINDVTVHIETFDYELPEPSQLIVKSEVDIYGIRDESEALPSLEEETSDPDGTSDHERALDETFQFDVTNVIEQDEEQLSPPAAERRSINETKTEDGDVAKEDHDPDDEVDRWKIKTKTQTFDEFFGKDVEKEDVEEQEDETHENDFIEPGEEELYDEESMDLVDSEDDDRDEDEPADANYLADLFREGDEEEEEQYTKMRLCIVQSDDTLEKIADRYMVTTLQLLKRNNMEDDDLSEGQLLYIPSKTNPIDYD